MKKFTHFVSLNIEVHSDTNEPTKEEVLSALKDAMDKINLDNVLDSTEWYDSEEN